MSESDKAYPAMGLLEHKLPSKKTLAAVLDMVRPENGWNLVALG